MKKKENEKMKPLNEAERHTVQVSERAWRALTVLKLMYKKSLGNIIEESAMNMIRSTPYGVAHLNFFLSSEKSDAIKSDADDNRSQVKKKTSKIAGRKNYKVSLCKEKPNGNNKN